MPAEFAWSGKFDSPSTNPHQQCERSVSPRRSHCSAASRWSRLCRIFTTCVFAIVLLPIATTPASAQSLQVKIEQSIKNSPISSFTVGISVRDADSSGRIELVDINSTQALIPASNMKLLTTGAALHVLGADFRFRTQMLLDRERKRLTIIGDGDPAFGDPELLDVMQVGDQVGIDIDQFIDLLIEPIIATGITDLDEIIVDDRIFDREFVHESWPREQLNRRSFAEVAGLNLHRNLLRIYLRPVPGSHADARDVRPQVPWLEINNRTTSHTGAGEDNTAWVSRVHMTNNMTLRGNARSSAVLVPVTVHNMPQLFAEILEDRLSKAGMSVRTTRIAALDEPDPTGESVGPIVTTPMPTIVEVCNVESQNLYAEALVKRLAHAVTHQPGSWTSGTAVIRHVVLERLGSPEAVSELQVADGSGLSRENQVAPSTISAWLCSFVHDEALGDTFINSLAVARESGTLARRFRQTDLHGATIRAKTGYIRGVSALSGYIISPDGGTRAFSILMNDLSMGALGHARQLQEQIVGLIAEDLATNADLDLTLFGGG